MTLCHSETATAPAPTTEKWIDTEMTIYPEDYRPEIYDVCLDKMLHQLNGFKHPYEDGHPTYIDCPVCHSFDDIVVRRYSKLENDITQFTIYVVFPDKLHVKIHVEEKKPDRQTIQLHFQVEASIIQTTHVLMKRSVRLQDFVLSWMNSILLELQNESKKYQENADFELNLEKEAVVPVGSMIQRLCSSLY